MSSTQAARASTLPDAQPFSRARDYQPIDDSPAPHPHLLDDRVVTMVKRFVPVQAPSTT